MILALDIGNTFIKTGIFDGDKLLFTEKTNANDFPSGSLKNYPIDSCAVSSVVPSVTAMITGILKDQFHIYPYIISNKSDFEIKIEYATPDTLGIDRICGAEGAYKLLKSGGNNFGPADVIVTIDFGTATTINLVRYPNIFTGGIIAPGIKMMFEALNRNTSQLPEVNFDEYKNIIGNSTASAIASGVLNATTGLIENTRAFFTGKLNTKNIFTYITGGNAELIIPHLGFKFTYEPSLVLHGINSVVQKMKKA
jgi:type III pantothenate kinase